MIMAIVEILQQNALLSIAGISALLALGSTLVYKYATDQSLIKAVREEIKKIQGEIKANKEDPKQVAELHKKMTPLNLRIMTQSLKPMIITIVPFLLIFFVLKNTYEELGQIIPLSFWEGHLGWIGTYIIFSLIFTTVFRKALKVA